MVYFPHINGPWCTHLWKLLLGYKFYSRCTSLLELFWQTVQGIWCAQVYNKLYGSLNTVYKIFMHIHVCQYVVVLIPALTATCFGCSAAVIRGVLDKDCCPPAASDSLWIIRDQQKFINTSQTSTINKAGKSCTRQAYENNNNKDRHFLAWIIKKTQSHI